MNFKRIFNLLKYVFSKMVTLPKLLPFNILDTRYMVESNDNSVLYFSNTLGSRGFEHNVHTQLVNQIMYLYLAMISKKHDNNDRNKMMLGISYCIGTAQPAAGFFWNPHEGNSLQIVSNENYEHEVAALNLYFSLQSDIEYPNYETFLMSYLEKADSINPLQALASAAVLEKNFKVRNVVPSFDELNKTYKYARNCANRDFVSLISLLTLYSATKNVDYLETLALLLEGNTVEDYLNSKMHGVING